MKIAEKILFYSSLALSILMIFSSPYNPSLDGPAHLYNSRLLGYLLSDNTFISSYLTFNKVPVPNLTDHYLLALLNVFFTATLSLKLMLSLCVASIALAFRAIIRLVNKDTIGTSAFAIPLTHSFLFYIGFYNFCLSLGFMLCSIYLYLKHWSTPPVNITARKYVGLFIFLLLTYFSNGLTFLITGMVLVLFEVKLIYQLILAREIKKLVQRELLFTSLWLPGIIYFILFMLLLPISGPSPSISISLSEHFKWIYHVRPLLVYNDNENIFTTGYFYLLLLMLLVSTYLFFKRKNFTLKNGESIFLIAAIIAGVLFFIVPNSTSVGMMSARLCLYFFIFFTLWIGLQENINNIKWPVIIIVYCLQWTLFFIKQWPTIKDLDNKASQIADAAKYIKPNSLVLPIDCTNYWCMFHFADYIGIDKPIIDVYNYETNLGWFPLVWQGDRVGANILALDDTIAKTLQWTYPGSKNNREIDYIFVLGDMNEARKKYPDIKNNIDLRCKLTYISADSTIHIYTVNHKPI